MDPAKSQTEIPASESPLPEANSPLSGEYKSLLEQDELAGDDPEILELKRNIEYEKTKADCIMALKAIERRKYKDGLEKIQAAREKYPTFAIVHCCRSEIYAQAAALATDDQDEKWRFLDEAKKSAREAVCLAPNDIEIARFLARKLFADATTKEEYEEVIGICQTGLDIKNPEFHGLQSLDEHHYAFRLVEGAVPHEDRIAKIRQDLKHLIQVSNLVMLSDWLKEEIRRRSATAQQKQPSAGATGGRTGKEQSSLEKKKEQASGSGGSRHPDVALHELKYAYFAEHC